MIWDVLAALVIFHSLCWLGKQAWKKRAQWREEEIHAMRREQHRARRHEQLQRALQNRKARREALLASLTPEKRAIADQIFAEDL